MNLLVIRCRPVISSEREELKSPARIMEFPFAVRVVRSLSRSWINCLRGFGRVYPLFRRRVHC